jgi:glycosyltransferase involved in cell wall biosynthesis
MQQVKQKFHDAHLLLVGNLEDATQVAAIEAEVARLHLSDNISILGQRHDVNAILSSCDVGVLSSIAEGLPLSLLEYGMAGLPVVATNVGQCADVLGKGEVGLIVPSRDPAALAQGLCRLLESEAERKRLGELFRQRVQNIYSARAVLQQITQVYEQLA